MATSSFVQIGSELEIIYCAFDFEILKDKESLVIIGYYHVLLNVQLKRTKVRAISLRYYVAHACPR